MNTHRQPLSTAAVLQEFNRAFLEHAPSLLPPLIAPDCVLEPINPATEGERLVGRDACLASWQATAGNRDGQFVLKDTWILGERGLIFWDYRVGGGVMHGLNVMTVRDGMVVEGLGYAKR